MSAHGTRAPGSAADLAADVLCEWLDAAIHGTLHRRGLYAREHFEVCRLYGVAVQRARAPALQDYISAFVAAARPMIRTGAAQLVAVVVTTAARVPLERHVFEVGLVGAAAAAAASLSSGARAPPAAPADAEALPGLERLLGEALMALPAADAFLRPLPPGTLECERFLPCFARAGV
jgi:hypothetical protein